MSRHISHYLFAVSLTILISTTQTNATPDLDIVSISYPEDTVLIGRSSFLRFNVMNVGTTQARLGYCNVKITRNSDGYVDYIDTIGVFNLPTGMATTLQGQTGWQPNVGGSYTVSVIAVHAEDNHMNNNTLTKEVVVQDHFITSAEASEILKQTVILPHSLSSTLTAIQLVSRLNQNDSLVRSPSTISPVDSNLHLSFQEPVYFYFIDYHPNSFFAHPCEFVAIAPTDGHVWRYPTTMWPEIDSLSPNFGSLCDENPNVVWGTIQDCPPLTNPTTAVGTNNTIDQTFAFSGYLPFNHRRNTRDYDLDRFIKRLNRSDYGPKVSNQFIQIDLGKEATGTSIQSLRSIFDTLRGNTPGRFYIKYIGNATRRGIVLREEGVDRAKILPWKEFASFFRPESLRETHLEITAPYGNTLLPLTQDFGLRGSVMSSSSNIPDRMIGSTGSLFEQDLSICSEIASSDINQDRFIDAAELFSCIKGLDRYDSTIYYPLFRMLVDSLPPTTATNYRIESQEPLTTTNGDLQLYVRGIEFLYDDRDTGNSFEDSIIYRSTLFLHNPNNYPVTAEQDYRILSVRYDQDKPIIDTLLQRYRPHIGSGEEIILARWESPCNALMAVPYSATVTPQPHIKIFKDISHFDGTFALYDLRATGTSGDRYTAIVDGPDSIALDISSKEFVLPASNFTLPQLSIHLPDSIHSGGVIVARLVNTTRDDTLTYRYRLYERDSVNRWNANIKIPEGREYGLYQLYNRGNINDDTVSIINSRLESHGFLGIVTRKASFQTL